MSEDKVHLSVLELSGGTRRAVGVASTNDEFQGALVKAFGDLRADELYLQVGDAAGMAFPSSDKAEEWFEGILKEAFHHVSDGTWSGKGLRVFSSAGKVLFNVHFGEAGT